MSPSRQRISARDYKNGGRRGGFDVGKYQQFGVGLGLGLLVALGVFVLDHRAAAPAAEAAPKSRSAKQAATTPDAGIEDPTADYDFYDMLSNYDINAERERDVKRDQPLVPVTKAGAYVVQVGSFRNEEDAERLRLKVGKLGIDANLQRVAIDADVRHRVRVGPLRDLTQLNEIRRQLRTADISPILLIRLGD